MALRRLMDIAWEQLSIKEMIGLGLNLILSKIEKGPHIVRSSCFQSDLNLTVMCKYLLRWLQLQEVAYKLLIALNTCFGFGPLYPDVKLGTPVWGNVKKIISNFVFASCGWACNSVASRTSTPSYVQNGRLVSQLYSLWRAGELAKAFNDCNDCRTCDAKAKLKQSKLSGTHPTNFW